MISTHPSKLKISFQAKVLIPVITFLVILPLVTSWILDRHIERSAHEEAQKSLSTVRAAFRNSLELRTRNIEIRFRDLVDEPRFKAVVQLGDSRTLEAFLQETLLDLDEETQVIVFSPFQPSQQSTGVSRNREPSLEVLEEKIVPLVHEALSGKISSGLMAVNKRILNLTSIPVVVNEGSPPLGVLTLGVEFGKRAVNDLKSLTRTEIVLFAGDSWIAGTIDQNGVNEKRGLILSESYSAAAVELHRIGREHYHILTGKLGNPVNPSEQIKYVLLSSYEESLRALSATRTVLSTVCILGILTSVFIIMVLIRNLTRPIRELRDGAEAVGRGDFSKRVHIRSGDECGELAGAFNQMTSNLQTSREQLESNLRQLTETQNQLLQREARLRESEEGLRLIIEGARDHVIFTIDYEGHIQRWNSAAERMLGFNSTEVKHLSYANFFNQEDQDKVIHKSLLERAARDGRAEFEGWRIGKDNIRFWADVTLSRLEKLPGSEEGGFVEIARDITARKQAEQALLDARNAAEASNRAKNEFMGNMSHEIRTPMNGIIGMTSLMMEEDLNEEQQDLIETIRTSADSLMEVIDDILDISKIEAGQLEINSAPVNLIELLEGTVESFAHVCVEKCLDLHVVVDGNVPHIFKTDPTRVRQILSNLIGNAVKFTEKGGIRIGMKYNRQESSLAFSVEDDGIGIPSDKLDRLFEPFFQVESTSARRFGGTGLGLSISKRIANLLNGEIKVESELGRGSLFRFEMFADPYGDGEPFSSFEGTHLLMASDSAATCAAIQSQVEQWGIRTDSVPTSSAIPGQLFSDSRYDLFLLDYSTTKISEPIGQLLETLQSGTDKFPPVLCIQAHNAKSGSPKTGRIEFVSNPLYPTELHGAIRVLLNKGNQSAPRKLNQLSSRRRLNGDFAKQYPFKILIAEDNEVNAKVLATILQRLGYKPEVASNGKECVEMLEAKAFNLIFMDLQMPVMDGYQATIRILNSNSIRHKVFITAFTANARQDDRDACASVGMHDFVAKPARPQKIMDVIKRAKAWFEVAEIENNYAAASTSPFPSQSIQFESESRTGKTRPPEY